MASQGPNRFFFLAAVATPNGRIHLGHIAGPYLRMDVAARYLRCAGHEVRIVCSVDSFDSYVQWTAAQERRSAREVCDVYRRKIVTDLNALDILIEDVIDVVDGPMAPIHAAGALEAVRTLIARGVVETVAERVLYSEATGRYIVGAWLSGRCPRCDGEAVGYFCEACGNFFRPEAMVDPVARGGETDARYRDVESLFLRIEDPRALERTLEEAGVAPQYMKIVRQFLQSESGLFRLTTPGTWGVPWAPDRHGNPRILVTSGWEYALSCGSRFMEIAGADIHPMNAESGVASAISFGLDNAILILVGCTAVLTALGHAKPFGAFLSNYFFNLEGRKFSTSRRHAIWASDIVNDTPATSDAVRFFLALNAPENATTDFVVDDFLAFNNDVLSDRLSANLAKAFAAIKGAGVYSPDAQLRRRLDSCYAAQKRALTLPALSIAAAARDLARYCRADELDLADAAVAFWWLKGLSLLSAPIMPQTARFLWRRIGEADDPLLARAYDPSSPREAVGDRCAFRRLSRRDLDPCLPRHLSGEAAAL